jgi:PAS domain S-box-containing protein
MTLLREYYKILGLAGLFAVLAYYFVINVQVYQNVQYQSINADQKLTKLKVINLVLNNEISSKQLSYNNDIINDKVYQFLYILDELKSLYGESEQVDVDKLEDLFVQKQLLIDDYKATNAVINNSIKFILESQKRLHHDLKTHIVEKVELVSNRVITSYIDSKISVEALVEAREELDQLLKKQKKYKDVLHILNHINVLIVALEEYKMIQSELNAVLIDELIDTIREESFAKFQTSIEAQMDLMKLLATLFVVVTIIGIVGFFQERKNNIQIQKLQGEVSNYVDIMDRYIISSKTGLKGIITEASQAFCDISGFTREELIGQPHSVVRAPDMPSSIFQEMWDKIQSNQTWQGEIKNRRKDGSYYWVLATITPEFNHKGEKVGYIAIRQDITDKKLVQQKQEQLIQQSRQAAMGEMIGMIAHQWRQPLSSISTIAGGIELAISLETLDNTKLQQEMDEINHLTQHLSQTVDDFRNFFKPNKEKQEIEVERLIADTLKLLKPLLVNHNVEIVQDIANIQLLTYGNELKQVIINILKNGLDQLVDMDVKEKRIEITTKTDNDHYFIMISDNGGGIPEDIIVKVFEPYFSTKSKNGTGLGLYMSKTIMFDHIGGDLRVSNSEIGAVFELMIPLHQSS